MLRTHADEFLERSRPDRASGVGEDLVFRPPNRQRSNSVPPERSVRPRLIERVRVIEREVPSPARRNVDFHDDYLEEPSLDRRERGRYGSGYADHSRYEWLEAERRRVESETEDLRYRPALAHSMPGHPRPWPAPEYVPRYNQEPESWRAMFDAEDQQRGKQVAAPSRMTGRERNSRIPPPPPRAIYPERPRARYEEKRSSFEPQGWAQERPSSLTRHAFQSDKTPQAIWDETSNRDVTLHFELDIEVDAEGKLEHFGRIKRLGRFEEAEEYFRNNLQDQLDNLAIAVEYASMLLEQGAYKRLDELIHDGEFNFPEEAGRREYSRPRALSERERRERTLREEEETRRRAEFIRAQDDEIRRRPAVPLASIPTTTTSRGIDEPRYVTAGEPSIDPWNRGPRQHGDYRERFPEAPSRQVAVYGAEPVHVPRKRDAENEVDRELRRATLDDRWEEVDVTTKVDGNHPNSLQNQLLRAELRLLVASANMYSHGDFQQVLAEMSVNQAALLAFDDREDDDFDSIWVQITHHMLKAISYIEKGSDLADRNDLRVYMNGKIPHWTGIYRRLILEGRVWDVRDIFAGMVSLYGASETWREVFAKDLQSPNSLDQYLQDSALEEYDESTHLAVLDTLVILARDLTVELRRTGDKNTVAAVQRILEHARSFAVAISEHSTESIKSSQYIRWIIAEETFSKQMAFIEVGKQEPIYESLTRFPGLTIWTGTLPIYVPVNEENPGWHSSSTPGKSTELLKIALKAAQGIGDYRTQAMCLGELICISKEPNEFISQLRSLQKDTMDDKVGYLETSLSKYLLLTDADSSKDLRDELVMFDARQTASYVVLNPLILWCESMIQKSLYSSSDRFQLEQAKAQRRASAYVYQLPAGAAGLIEDFNLFPRNGIDGRRRPGGYHDGESEYRQYESERAMHVLRRELHEAEAARRRSDEETARLKEELARTNTTDRPAQTTVAPQPLRPNGNHFSTPHNEVSMQSGADDLQRRTSEHEHGEHQQTQKEHDEAFYAWVQAAGSHQPKLLMDKPYSFTATKSNASSGYYTGSDAASRSVVSRDRIIVIEEDESPRRRYKYVTSGTSSPITKVVESHNDTATDVSEAGKDMYSQQTLDGWLSKTKSRASTISAGSVEHQKETEDPSTNISQRQTDEPPDDEPVEDDVGWGWTPKKAKGKTREEAGATTSWPGTGSPWDFSAVSTESRHVALDNPGEEGESSRAGENKDLQDSETPEQAAEEVGAPFDSGRRKKQKKTVLELLAEEAAVDDEWGLRPLTKKKKKKTRESSGSIGAAEPEIDEWSFGLGTKKKKKKKAEELPSDETVQQPDVAGDDEWASFSSRGKKKKKRTSPLQEIIEHTDDVQPVKPDGSSGMPDSKRKQKMEGIRSIDEVLLSTPVPFAEAGDDGREVS